MRTAIISDLHLGLLSGGDLLRDPSVRAILLEEIGGADRVVLLGDAVELREVAVGTALDAARPFFEDLGAALGEREVTLVPGNHDHHLAEPLLDDLSLDGAPLGLAESRDPSPGPTAAIDRWLGPARLRVAYPGVWVREDVYATHGHYMDAHLNLPRAECLAVATLLRLSRPLPDPATPEDYERALRPIYGFAYGVAQARRQPWRAAPRALGGRLGGARRRRAASAAAAGGSRSPPPAPASRSPSAPSTACCAPSSTPTSRSARSSRAASPAPPRWRARLGVDGAHVITGHSHRAGPKPDEAEWPLPGGGSLHNTGSWVFSSAFHHPGRPPNSYWPGTVTWVEDEGPPRRVQLLAERPHEEIAGIAAGIAGAPVLRAWRGSGP